MNNQYGQGNAFIKQETATDDTATLLVTPPAATAFDDNYTLATTLNAGTETAVVVSPTPPPSLGTRGTIRVQTDYGIHVPITYTNRSGATFTIDTGGPQRFLNQASTVATTALTGSAVTAVEVAAIDAETPQVGKLRITLNSAATVDVEFTSWTGSTFTIVATDFSGDNADVGNATLTLLQATSGNMVAIGIENRIILRGWTIGASNTVAAIHNTQLQTNASAGAQTLVKVYLAPTSGVNGSDNSGVHIPLPAGESLQILQSNATGVTTEATVWGEFAPFTTPQCTGYAYGTP